MFAFRPLSSPSMALSASPRMPMVIRCSYLPLRFRPSAQKRVMPSRLRTKFQSVPYLAFSRWMECLNSSPARRQGS